MPNDLEWAEAFNEQAQIDLDLSKVIQSLQIKEAVYNSIVVAHCQQAIEKSLKAMIFAVEGKSSKLRNHNPLEAIQKMTRTKEVLSKHKIVHSNEKNILNDILNLAPGAGVKNKSIDNLLHQCNTEYPFVSSKTGVICMPWESITEQDVIKAIRQTDLLVPKVKKYIFGLKRRP